MPDGSTVYLSPAGVVKIFSKDRKSVETGVTPIAPRTDEFTSTPARLDKAYLAGLVSRMRAKPYKDGTVLVVFRTGNVPAADVQTFRRPALGTTPAYTPNRSLNRILAKVGTTRIERMFRAFARGELSAMHSAAEGGAPALPLENAFQLHVTGSSVRSAVAALLASPAVLYASPDWTVATANTPPVPVPQPAIEAADRDSFEPFLPATPRLQSGRRISQLAPEASTSTLPTNYALQSSAQSLLNAPSVNAAAAYDEIEKTFHQLPGTGEIITNVSLGDVDDLSNPKDPCYVYAQYFGPTTVKINGQRYIDWPSMPLIPAYVADDSGQITKDSSCGIDPLDSEIGLDFSMMAPLPHNQQRAGAIGKGYADLLGIAPGASYRLVVTNDPSLGGTDEALLAAASQRPRPSVITASLGPTEEGYGLPSRFLDDDPLSNAVLSSIVHEDAITVCVSAGDGLRIYTNAAWGPSGGAAPTNVAAPGTSTRNLSDVALSTVASKDYDSGAIDVGATTLDDIFAAEPQGASRQMQAQHAFPETRWTGFMSFASGYGSRVNLSAPGDNVLGLAHTEQGAYDSVTIDIEGGTSASAPEAAASAAVLLQVARLTGKPFSSPADLRTFMEKTATAVPAAPQADPGVDVGPQINLGNAVETLLARAGKTVRPDVPRVAVEQRRNEGTLNSVIITATNPRAIDLTGPLATDKQPTNRNAEAWITIAPDWEGVPANSRYALFVEGKRSKPLATTRWARLLPETILSADGKPLVDSGSRTVKLRYAATMPNGSTLSVPVVLTFGPAAEKSDAVLAPVVPGVVTGSTIPVQYDLSHADHLSKPLLLVSYPGRTNPATGPIYRPAYEVRLTGMRGTVNVPVSKLQGGGIYGIGIQFGTLGGAPLYSDFAITHLEPTKPIRPSAPEFAQGLQPFGYAIALSPQAGAKVKWDVSNVPGANGAKLEFSAPENVYASYQTFNNVNGTKVDHNGADTGSLGTIDLERWPRLVGQAEM